VKPAFKHGGSVYTNDPRMPEIRFNVLGSVDSAVSLKPDGAWDAGDLAGQESTTFDTWVFTRVLPKLTIQSATTDSEFTSVDFTPMTAVELEHNKALAGYRCRVTVQPEFPIGDLNDELKITVSELDEPLEITLRARRRGAIHITGIKGTLFNTKVRGLDLGRFNAAQGRKAELMLIVNHADFDEDLQLLEVETDPKVLRVSLEPIGQRSGRVARYRMTVEMPKGATRMTRLGDSKGTILCRTNHPADKEILLLVKMHSF